VRTSVAIVPGLPALLHEYSSRVDPVPEVRDACREGVAWLAERSPSTVTVMASSSTALRVAEWLLTEVGFTGEVARSGSPTGAEGLLVVANGSARRGEKAPGHLDPRSFDFDEQLETALGKGDAAALGDIDLSLADALLADGLGSLRSLVAFADASVTSTMLYAGDPYGVRYWVATWDCSS